MRSGTTVRQLRRRLVEKLVAAGAICTSQWDVAFSRVPRHLFVPRFHRLVDGVYCLLDSADPCQYDTWLTTAYQDDDLVVRFAPEDPTRPLSSSSRPTLMAHMLECLDVQPGHRVLEIGTGSGYNAALLCEQARASCVTTVDRDDELVRTAEQHLHAAGYRPTVAIANGADGYPPGAPYDRIIATCATHLIPTAWLEQASPGAVIVAIVSTGILRLTVDAHNAAEGRFHGFPVRHLPMMCGLGPELPSTSEAIALTRHGGTREQARHPWAILNNDTFCFFLRLTSPFVVPYGPDANYDPLLDIADHSWARWDPRDRTVTQGGPRRLWSETEHRYDEWLTLGAPDRDLFGLTILPNADHIAWLDDPGSQHRWKLTAPAATPSHPAI
jgi:protein-L-isoaspartate O-methyltransferase